MTRKIIVYVLAVLGVAGVIVALGGAKALQIKHMITEREKMVMPPRSVTTGVVVREQWETSLSAVGSLEAVQGQTITAELTGRVSKIAFEAGSAVQAGDLLVQQDTSSEAAQLRAIETNMTLAKVNLDRAEKLVADQTISKSEYDQAQATYLQFEAEADTIRATIAKKSIRAPYAGRLGIRLINVGQILREGDGIVSLQKLDPIFVNFLLPQQYIASVKVGMQVRVTIDAFAGESFMGDVTTINPEVDANSRNIRIQATLRNEDERLRPGMYAEVHAVLPDKDDVLMIPATAVLHAPYSDMVFLVEDGPTTPTAAELADAATTATTTTADAGPKPVYGGLVARQHFVTLGASRGDFVAVAKGLEEGQKIVTTGVFKLRNGQSIVERNEMAPDFELNPTPEDN